MESVLSCHVEQQQQQQQPTTSPEPVNHGAVAMSNTRRFEVQRTSPATASGVFRPTAGASRSAGSSPVQQNGGDNNHSDSDEFDERGEDEDDDDDLDEGQYVVNGYEGDGDSDDYGELCGYDGPYQYHTEMYGLDDEEEEGDQEGERRLPHSGGAGGQERPPPPDYSSYTDFSAQELHEFMLQQQQQSMLDYACSLRRYSMLETISEETVDELRVDAEVRSELGSDNYSGVWCWGDGIDTDGAESVIFVEEEQRAREECGELDDVDYFDEREPTSSRFGFDEHEQTLWSRYETTASSSSSPTPLMASVGSDDGATTTDSDPTTGSDVDTVLCSWRSNDDGRISLTCSSSSSFSDGPRSVGCLEQQQPPPMPPPRKLSSAGSCLSGGDPSEREGSWLDSDSEGEEEERGDSEIVVTDYRLSVEVVETTAAVDVAPFRREDELRADVNARSADDCATPVAPRIGEGGRAPRVTSRGELDRRKLAPPPPPPSTARAEPVDRCRPPPPSAGGSVESADAIRRPDDRADADPYVIAGVGSVVAAAVRDEHHAHHGEGGNLFSKSGETVDSDVVGHTKTTENHPECNANGLPLSVSPPFQSPSSNRNDSNGFAIDVQENANRFLQSDFGSETERTAVEMSSDWEKVSDDDEEEVERDSDLLLVIEEEDEEEDDDNERQVEPRSPRQPIPLVRGSEFPSWSDAIDAYLMSLAQHRHGTGRDPPPSAVPSDHEEGRPKVTEPKAHQGQGSVAKSCHGNFIPSNDLSDTDHERHAEPEGGPTVSGPARLAGSPPSPPARDELSADSADDADDHHHHHRLAGGDQQQNTDVTSGSGRKRRLSGVRSTPNLMADKDDEEDGGTEASAANSDFTGDDFVVDRSQSTPCINSMGDDADAIDSYDGFAFGGGDAFSPCSPLKKKTFAFNVAADLSSLAGSEAEAAGPFQSSGRRRYLGFTSSSSNSGGDCESSGEESDPSSQSSSDYRHTDGGSSRHAGALFPHYAAGALRSFRSFDALNLAGAGADDYEDEEESAEEEPIQHPAAADGTDDKSDEDEARALPTSAAFGKTAGHRRSWMDGIQECSEQEQEEEKARPSSEDLSEDSGYCDWRKGPASKSALLEHRFARSTETLLSELPAGIDAVKSMSTSFICEVAVEQSTTTSATSEVLFGTVPVHVTKGAGLADQPLANGEYSHPGSGDFEKEPVERLQKLLAHDVERRHRVCALAASTDGTSTYGHTDRIASTTAAAVNPLQVHPDESDSSSCENSLDDKSFPPLRIVETSQRNNSSSPSDNGDDFCRQSAPPSPSAERDFVRAATSFGLSGTNLPGRSELFTDDSAGAETEEGGGKQSSIHEKEIGDKKLQLVRIDWCEEEEEEEVVVENISITIESRRSHSTTTTSTTSSIISATTSGEASIVLGRAGGHEEVTGCDQTSPSIEEGRAATTDDEWEQGVVDNDRTEMSHSASETSNAAGRPDERDRVGANDALDRLSQLCGLSRDTIDPSTVNVDSDSWFVTTTTTSSSSSCDLDDGRPPDANYYLIADDDDGGCADKNRDEFIRNNFSSALDYCESTVDDDEQVSLSVDVAETFSGVHSEAETRNSFEEDAHVARVPADEPRLTRETVVEELGALSSPRGVAFQSSESGEEEDFGGAAEKDDTASSPTEIRAQVEEDAVVDMQHVGGRTFAIVGGPRYVQQQSSVQSGSDPARHEDGVGEVQLESEESSQNGVTIPPRGSGSGVASRAGLGKPPLPPQHRPSTLPAPCRSKIVDARQHFQMSEQQQQPSPPTSPEPVSDTIDGFRQRAQAGRDRAARSVHELVELERACRSQQLRREEERLRQRHLAGLDPSPALAQISDEEDYSFDKPLIDDGGCGYGYGGSVRLNLCSTSVLPAMLPLTDVGAAASNDVTDDSERYRSDGDADKPSPERGHVVDGSFSRTDLGRRTLPAYLPASAATGVASRKSSLTGSTFSVNGFYLETDVDTFHSREVIRVPENELQREEQQQRYFQLRQRFGRDTDEEDDEEDGDCSAAAGGRYNFGALGGSVHRYRPHRLKTQSCFNLTDDANMAATATATAAVAGARHDNGHATGATDDFYGDDDDGSAPKTAPVQDATTSARMHLSAGAPMSHPYDDRARSMEFLLRDENKMAAWPPENQLRAAATERVPSEHELRIRRSLQKLNLPDWYKNSPLANQMGSTEGFILRRDSSGSERKTTPRWEEVRSRRSHSASNILGSNSRLSCATPTSVGSGRQNRSVVIAQRVTTPDWRHVKSSRESLLQSPVSPSPYCQYYSSQGVGPGASATANSSMSRWSSSRLSTNSTATTASSPRSSSPTGSLLQQSSAATHHRTSLYPRQPYLGWRSSERLAREAAARDATTTDAQQPQQQQHGNYFYRSPAERMSHGPGYYALRYGMYNRNPTAPAAVSSGTEATTPAGSDGGDRRGSGLSGTTITTTTTQADVHLHTEVTVNVIEPNGLHPDVQEYSTSGRMEVAELVREIDKLIHRNGHVVQQENGDGEVMASGVDLDTCWEQQHQQQQQQQQRVPSPHHVQLQQSQLEALAKMSPKTAARQKVMWMESSFVGVRPLSSASSSPPPEERSSPGRTPANAACRASPVGGESALDSTANKSEHRIASLNNSNSSSSNTATNTNTNTASNYNREADQQQRRPSLTSTTLEEVLDSLLALPPNTGGSTVGSSGGQWGECGGESAGNFPSSPQCHAIRSSVPQLDDSRAASATPPSSLYRPSAPPYEHSDTDVDDDEVDLDAPPPDDVTAIHQYEQTSFVPQLTVGLVEAADSLRSSLSSTTSGPAGEAVVVEKGEEEEGGGSDLTTATATVASGSASSRSSVSGGGSGEGSGSGDSMSGQSRSSSISVSSASSSSSTGSSTGSGSSTSGSSSGKEGAGGAAAVIPPPPDFTDRLNTNGGRVTEAVPSPTPVADFREACAELGEGDRHFEHYHSTSTAPVADSHASARLDSFGAVEVEEVVVEEMKPDVVEELQYDVAAIVERSRPAHRSVTNDEVDALLAATLLIPAEVAGSSAAPLPPRGGASGSSSSDSFPPPPDSVQMEEINRRQADDEAYHSLEVGGGTGSYQQVSPCETDIDPYVFAHVTKLQPILSSDEVDEDSDRCDSNEDNDEVEVKVDRPPFVEPYDEQPPFDSGIGYSGYGIEAALDDFFSQNNPASRIHEALYEDVDLLGSDEVGSCAHSSLHPPPPASSAADTSMGSIDCNSRYDDRTSIGTTFTSFAHVSSPQERRSEVEIRLSGSSDYYHSTTAVDESGGTAPPSESTSTRRAGQRVTGKHTRADSQLDDSVIVKCSHDQCKHSAELRDARRSFRTCHNCYTYYCSRECRKDHWMRHRRVCMYGRIRSMCKQALQCARDTPATQLYLSRLARTGFLTQGRGFVKLLFRNTDLALSFLRHGWNQLEDGPVYVAWKDLIPQEMGEEVYRAVVDLCQRYEPDAKFVLLAAVYITREVPLQTVPHWEREIVAKCARVPLHPRAIHNQEVPLLPEPSAGGAATTTTTTLIITGPPPSVAGRVGEVTVDAEGDRRHAREACFVNIQEQLLERGVNLRAQFGEAYAKLLAYVERDDPFPPLTIYPKDGRTGQTFMCVIMPDNGSGGGAPVVPDWLRGKYV